jgi:hypothetical protein
MRFANSFVKSSVANPLWGAPRIHGAAIATGRMALRSSGALQRWAIRDRLTSARSPWHGYAERLIGSIRRECLDHVVVFGE